jgi:uncharacterized protein (DUF305 family)
MYKFAAIALFCVPLALGADQAHAGVMFPDVCKSSSGEGVTSMSAMQTASPSRSADDSYESEAMAGMDSMNRDMAAGMSNKDADVAFICGMMAHHLGAISMSQLELKYGSDPTAKALATKIIAIQNRELEEMDKWLKIHDTH